MKSACNGHTDIALALMEAGADVHIVAKVRHLEYCLESGILTLVLDPGPSVFCDSSSYLDCV
jgi:hypothetical protein